MKLIVQSTAVWDTITVPGVEGEFDAPGGAGFYALAGMKVWEDDITIVTGTGEDYLSRFGGWYYRNSISTQGLMIKDSHTPRTMIRYDAEGERVEESAFGAAHYKHIEATPEEIEPFCMDCSGMYVFKNTDPKYWQGILALKQKYGFRLLWEIAADATNPKNLSAVRRIAEETDMFSINLTEARSLLQLETLEELAEAFSGWEVPLVYLRLGSRGVCLIQKDRTVFVPSVPNARVVDATGGGNSSTGGAFVGFCREYPLERIGAMGNVSASFCIEQWGVPECFGQELRREAVRRHELITGSMK